MNTIEQLLREHADCRIEDLDKEWTGQAGREAVYRAMQLRLAKFVSSLISDDEVKRIAEDAHYESEDD